MWERTTVPLSVLPCEDETKGKSVETYQEEACIASVVVSVNIMAC
jgi:hypothetical protein